jgi:hypothetical protein
MSPSRNEGRSWSVKKNDPVPAINTREAKTVIEHVVELSQQESSWKKKDVGERRMDDFEQDNRSRRVAKGDGGRRRSKRGKKVRIIEEDAVASSTQNKQGLHIEEACSSVRDAVATKLRDSVCDGGPQHDSGTMQRIDSEFALRSTEALINMNQEIWERLSRVVVPGGDTASPRMTATVVHFPSVRVVKLNREKVIFEANAHYQVCEHDSSVLFDIPPDLSAIFPLGASGGGTSMPDYRSYLERALLLHSDVLVPFLWKFKEFLETVQVFLGQLDTAIANIREPSAQFLEDAFQFSINENYWREAFEGHEELLGEDGKRSQEYDECVMCCRAYGSRVKCVYPGKPCKSSSICLRTYRCTKNFKYINIEYDVSNVRGQEQLRECLRFMDSQFVQHESRGMVTYEDRADSSSEDSSSDED